MKKSIIIVVIIAIIAAVIVGIVMMNKKGDNEEKQEIKIETAGEMKEIFSNIYEKLGDKLPSIDTQEIDITDEEMVTSFTGLKSTENIEALVVSEPMMSSQAYSAVLVKVSKDADIEEMKKEMIDNIDIRKWICVSAEKVYVTNCGDVIFLIMSSEDWAKPVYDEFKKEVNENIGKELERTEEI